MFFLGLFLGVVGGLFVPASFKTTLLNLVKKVGGLFKKKAAAPVVKPTPVPQPVVPQVKN